MPIQHLKYITACSGSGLAWVFALLLGAGVRPAAAQPPTLTLSNPHTSGLVEGQRTGVPITASENPTSSLPVTLKFTRTGDFMNPVNLNCLKGDGTGKAACPYEVDLFDYDPDEWIINFRTKDDEIDEPDGTLTVVIEYGEGLTSNSVTVDIRDNDPTVVSLARVGSEVISDGGAAEFTVTLGRALVAGEVIDVPLAISGTGVSADGYTLSVTSGTGAALFGTNTLTLNTVTRSLRFSGAGAQTATLALRPAAASTVERYRIALGPDGTGANGFDRTGLGTNVGGGADPHGTQNSFHVWKDLGHPSVTITGGPAEISEGSTASFTLTANPAPSTPFTLTVEVTESGDFAAAGQTGSRTVSIGPDGTGSFTVTTVDDSVYEPDGVINATVQVGDGYTVGVPSSASVAVLELPDDVPYISIKRVPYGINEGGTATFALTASYPPAAPITVNVNVRYGGGFAAPGQTGSRTATIGTDGRGSLTVTTVDDSTFELNGLFKATVQSGSDYKVGSPSWADIIVRDNDRGSQTLTVGGPTRVTEGQEFELDTQIHQKTEEPQPLKRTFTRTGDFMATHHGASYWPTLSESYRNYQDWLQGDGTDKGAWTDTYNWRGPRSSIWVKQTKNDRIDEPDGTITMTSEYGDDPTSPSHTVLIRDNDPTVVSLARTGTVSTVAFTVTLGRALVAGEVIDVPLVVSGAGVSADGYTLSVASGTGAALSGTGTLTPTLRFSGSGAQEAMLKLVPAAGSSVERYTIALGPDGDGANGFDRSGLGTNVGGGADPHGTRNSFDVKRGAMEPSVSITGGPDVTEGSTATFTVTASPAPSTPVTVMVDVTDSGSFAGDGQAGSRSVTVGVDGTGSLTVTTVNDGIDDWEGSVTATLQAGADYTVSAPSSAAVAVLNDGVQLPDFNLSLRRRFDPSGGVTEGTRFLLVISPTWRVNIPLQVGLKATQAGDFLTRGSRRLYKYGTVDDSHWIYFVNTDNDDMDEPDGTVTMVAEYGNGRTSNSITVPIIDDDPTVVSLSRTGAGAVSAGSGVAFTVSLGRALVAGEVIDVPLAVSGAGVSVDDYTLSVTGGTGAALSGTDTLTPTLRFSGAGAQTTTLELVASVAKQYQIALGPDGRVANGFDRPGVGTNVGGGADPHATENHFHVEVTAAQQHPVLQEQLFQQHGEPTAPEVGIALAAGGTEGAEVLFMLSATPAPSEPLAVALTVSQEGDHVVAAALGQRTVTVPTSGSVTVSIPTVDDDVEEADGTVTATLAAGSGYTLGLLSTMAVAVVDNDEVAPVLTSTQMAEPVAVSLSAERSSIAEAKGKTKFRIELSRALVAGEVVRVPFTMSGGREDHHWKVHFREAHNGPGVKRTATGKKSAVRFTKGGRVATLMLVAQPNKDTAARTISIGFGEGQRTPSSAGVAGGIVLMGEPLAVAIIDDDRVAPTVTVSAGDGVPEGDGASFSLRADPAPASDLAVTVSIGGSGGAVAPSGQGERTVTLPKGEREASFTVATVDDGADGPGGTVTATVVAQEGYTLGDVSTAVVVVKDDDATVVRLSGPAGDVAEAGGGKVLTVALGRVLAAGESLTVPLVLGGVARLGSDYTLSAPGSLPQGVSYAHLGGSEGSSPPTLTFSGPSSAAATVRFTATEDTATEGASETVTVGLGTLTATGLDGGAQGLGTVGFAILEPPPQVGVSAKSAAVTEGGAAVFTVTASRVAESDLTVHLAVSEADGGDFVAAEQEGAASVSIPKGGREASFTVSTVDDGVDEPDGRVTVTLAVDGEEGQRYTVAAAPKDAASVAVRDNDAAPTVPTLSVEDATVHEQERLMYFTVRLSPGAEEPVTVSFHTRHASPVSAREYQDYVEMDTSVSFAPKETEKKALVYIFDDSHDEGRETFEVVLSDAKGAVIGDGVAVGAIVNDDPLPAAWLVRFGRTVSHQVVDALQQRFTTPPSASGLHLSVAGEELTGAAPLVENQQVLAKVLGFERVSAQQVVEGSSFSFSPQATAGEQGEGEGGGGRFSLWGQGALSSFSGAEDSVSLDGEVTTALVGAEWSTARWQAGAALSHSWGSGDYEGEGHHREGEEGHPGHPGGDGRISSSLTGIFPYGRYALTPRLGVWGVAGAGRGQLSLKPDGDGREYQPDISLGMAAVGIDGLLLDGGPAGLRLTTTTDLLTVSTTSEAVQGLKASDGTVSRLRLGLEAARPFPLSSGASLLPSLEVGIRQDSGDAETGFGLELGTGLSWHDARRGIRTEMRGRSLLSHADEEFREQGLAVSLAWDPTPSRRGPSLSLSHAVGATAAGGMDAALLHPVVLEGLAAPSSEGQQQFETRFAYGFPIFSDQLTLSPALELALSPTSRTYSLLWTVAPHAPQPGQAAPWELSLEGERQEHAAASPTQHSLRLRFSLLF